MSHEILSPHPDRLLPVDPAVRKLARRIYESIAELPIISPHGHVDPNLLLRNEPFDNPATLFITPDHYTTRLLHASGVELSDLGVGQGPLSEEQARAVWRRFCERWDLYAGTPVQYWFESEFAEIFGVREVPSAATADAIYDRISSRLVKPSFRPRALLERFRIELLATTDDPADGLQAHQALRDDPTFTGRVIPTFRPDRYLEALKPGWNDAVNQLGAAAAMDTGNYWGYRDALQNRRWFFKQMGGVSTDHSHLDAYMTRLDDHDAARLFDLARAGQIDQAGADAFRRHMMWEMARMATEDGLVMTLHHGVFRNHHQASFEAYGADTGHDIPLKVEWVNALREVLNDFGKHPKFKVVLFALDESGWAREMAALAGFYPSVYVGSPWWFHDNPNAIRRWRESTSEIAGFSRYSGFIDDTRAFLSIPARHDMSRRLDAGFLAQQVAEHRISKATALTVAERWTNSGPREVFNL